ncbi:MAG: DUF3524 domain-containing protein [Pseudomonadota bacterium]
MTRVLLLSAYAAASHRYWRQRLADMLPLYRWRVEELPPRHFSWRVRGNPLHWHHEGIGRHAAQSDVLLATSMVDLATLRGLQPELARLPTALYFHENQFAYPLSSRGHGLLEAQMVSLYGALAADRLWFNSAFNLESFLDGLGSLLKRLPDLVPEGVVAVLRAKSSVLPVPVLAPTWEAGMPDRWPRREHACELRLIWLGRLEHDKGGEQLLAALSGLERAGIRFRLAVVGQTFRELPGSFANIKNRFGYRLVHFGYAEAVSDYHALLRGADLVLSTALHEFQGIAVMEAVMAGCRPLLPARQAYPEIYGQEYLYASHPDDPEQEASAVVEAVKALLMARDSQLTEAPSLDGYEPDQLGQRYASAFTELRGLAG